MKEKIVYPVYLDAGQLLQTLISMGIRDPVKTMSSTCWTSNEKISVNEQETFTLIFKTIGESRSPKDCTTFKNISYKKSRKL